jgi:hypothetical protein
MTVFRRLTAGFAVLALSLVLVGAGLIASYSDRGAATQNLAVGTFGCVIDTDVVGADVDNSGDVSTVTFTAPKIQSSAANAVALPFTVTSLGTVPLKVHLTQTIPVAPFYSSLPDPVADVNLLQGEGHLYAGGLSWPMLGNADLGKKATITYTAQCGESGAPGLPGGPAVTLTGGTVTYPQTPGTLAPPVINAQMQTITWTIPVTTSSTPMTNCYLSCYLTQYPNVPMGTFTATSTGAIRITAEATLSPSLVGQGTFQLGYVSTVANNPFSLFNPAKNLNVAPFRLDLDPQWSAGVGGHHPTYNGVGVKWSGVPAGALPGTITIVQSFVAQ